MSYAIKINSLRLIKLCYRVAVATLLCYLTYEHYELQRDNYILEGAVRRMAETCIVVGKP